MVKETAKHRVLKYLIKYRNVTLNDIRRKEIGGTAAYIRLNELTRPPHNIPIKWDYFIDPDTGKKTNLTYYNLAVNPRQIDYKNLKLKIPRKMVQAELVLDSPQVDNLCPICGGYTDKGGVDACFCTKGKNVGSRLPHR